MSKTHHTNRWQTNKSSTTIATCTTSNEQLLKIQKQQLLLQLFFVHVFFFLFSKGKCNNVMCVCVCFQTSPTWFLCCVLCFCSIKKLKVVYVYTHIDIHAHILLCTLTSKNKWEIIVKNFLYNYTDDVWAHTYICMYVCMCFWLTHEYALHWLI